MKVNPAVVDLRQELQTQRNFHGRWSPEANDVFLRLIAKENHVAMNELARDKYKGPESLLNRALRRAELFLNEGGFADQPELQVKVLRLKALTLNNLGCYWRRRNEFQKALDSLMEAVKLEAMMGHKNCPDPASSLLNLCAVTSALGRHHAALSYAKESLSLIQTLPQYEVAEGEDKSPSSEAAIQRRCSLQSMALFNVAAELEHLGTVGKAAHLYKEGLAYTRSRLGPAHPVTVAFSDAVNNLKVQTKRTSSRSTSTPRSQGVRDGSRPVSARSELVRGGGTGKARPVSARTPRQYTNGNVDGRDRATPRRPQSARNHTPRKERLPRGRPMSARSGGATGDGRNTSRVSSLPKQRPSTADPQQERINAIDSATADHDAVIFTPTVSSRVLSAEEELREEFFRKAEKIAQELRLPVPKRSKSPLLKSADRLTQRHQRETSADILDPKLLKLYASRSVNRKETEEHLEEYFQRPQKLIDPSFATKKMFILSPDFEAEEEVQKDSTHRSGSLGMSKSRSSSIFSNTPRTPVSPLSPKVSIGERLVSKATVRKPRPRARCFQE